MSDIEWDMAREGYADGKITKPELWPYWKSRVQELMNLEVGADREHQLEPLFQHGWGPKDAADHLLRVWALKGWLPQ